LAEISNLLERLSIIFEKSELKYVIVGGVAVIHYGHIRNTQDIYIIIEDDKSKFNLFLDLLEENDFDVMRDQFNMAYKENTNVSIFDNKSFLRLDIKFAKSNIEKMTLDSACCENVFGKKIYIASLNNILIGKIIYMGDISSISNSKLLGFQDVIDFLTIFHANKDRIDLDLLKKEVKRLGMQDRLDKLLQIKLN